MMGEVTDLEWRCAQAACCRMHGEVCKRGEKLCDAVDYLDMVRAVLAVAQATTTPQKPQP